MRSGLSQITFHVVLGGGTCMIIHNLCTLSVQVPTLEVLLTQDKSCDCSEGLMLSLCVGQVKLTCGKETVVTSTSEPSRCEYLMEFTTPAVCQEPASLDEVLHGHTEL